MGKPACWHLITPEYPPSVGGVADYSANVAEGLRQAGSIVQVWSRSNAPDQQQVVGEHFSPAALQRLSDAIDATPKPRRLLVQYVPHGYGYKAMNLAFVAWVGARRWRHGDAVDVMFHEVTYPWVRTPLRHNLLALVNRGMAWVLARAASRVFVSIPAWGELLRPFTNPRTPIIWSPIPAALVLSPEPSPMRSRLLGSRKYLLGHFGTYGANITPLLESTIPTLTKDEEVQVLLLGQNSDRWLGSHPQWAGRVTATGSLELKGIIQHLQACDAVVLPYPDGISSRRTTAMLPLAHGVPIITNLGHLSENLWTPEVVGLSDSPLSVGQRALQILRQGEQLQRLGQAGFALYQDRFALKHAIHQLLEL